MVERFGHRQQIDPNRRLVAGFGERTQLLGAAPPALTFVERHDRVHAAETGRFFRSFRARPVCERRANLRLRIGASRNFDTLQNIVDLVLWGDIFDSCRNDRWWTVVDKKAAIAALGALAQETRLDLFRLLVTVGP